MQPAALLGLLAFATAINAAPAVGTSQGSVQTLKDNIKNVVVLVMENRSFDNLLGGQTLKGLENPIQSGPYCNPYDINDPSQGQACTAAKDYDSVANDPDHGVTGNNIEFYSQWAPNNTAIESGELQANMQGFMYEQARKYQSRVDKETLAKQVMNYYTENQVPVLTELVQNYVTFNRWFSGVPGVSFQLPLT
jgi:phospholipase C